MEREIIYFNSIKVCLFLYKMSIASMFCPPFTIYLVKSYINDEHDHRLQDIAIGMNLLEFKGNVVVVLVFYGPSTLF